MPSLARHLMFARHVSPHPRQLRFLKPVFQRVGVVQLWLGLAAPETDLEKDAYIRAMQNGTPIEFSAVLNEDNSEPYDRKKYKNLTGPGLSDHSMISIGNARAVGVAQ